MHTCSEVLKLSPIHFVQVKGKFSEVQTASQRERCLGVS